MTGRRRRESGVAESTGVQGKVVETGVRLVLPILEFRYLLRPQKPSAESISNLITASGVVNTMGGTGTVGTYESKRCLKKYSA